MAKPALLAVGAIVLVVGGVAAGYGFTRKAKGGMTPEQTQAMTLAVGQLASDIRTAREAVKVRATTFATLPSANAVVSADAATATEMVRGGELAFKPEPGEVIEIGHITKVSGSKPEILVVQPDGAMQNPHAGEVGSFIDLMGDQVVVIEVARLAPKYDADKFDGYIAVSRPLNLKSALERLSGAGVTGTLEIAGQKRAIGAPPANAPTRDMPLESVPDAKFIAAEPRKVGGPNMAVGGGGGVAAILGLIVLVAGLVGKSSSAPAASSTALPPVGTTPPAFGDAATQMSTGGFGGVGAAATPSPVNVTGGGVGDTTNFSPGSMIGGKWEIIKRLGSGGMADVYLAKSKGEAGFEKTVAVKVMHPHLARNQRAVDHFLDEARLAVSITHPNVVGIQDLGKIGNDYVIVMEYVDGVDLDRLLSNARASGRAVPIEVGLGILCRILDGLNAAHTAIAKDGTPLQIIHRDVKAANVLVSKQGGVKVVDFGIAKAAQQVHYTVAGETKGTPSMMAPEQRVGEVVDVRADVYSAAAVAFEVLTGQAVNLDLAALAHLGVENWPHLPPPSSLRPQLPAELDKLVLGAMAFERDKRPASAAAFEAALEAIMKKHGLTCSDKDIGRWVSQEIAAMQTQLGHGPTGMA